MRLLKIFLSTWACVVLFSCVTAPAQERPRFKVVTSFYPMYVMTLNIAGDIPGVEVANLTPPVTGCLHDYTLTTSDMKKLADADIFVVNGGGMESFLEQVARQYPRITIIRASAGLELIKDRAGENPHVWVSLSGAIEEARNIARGLEAADPGNAQRYRKNAQAYAAKLAALGQKMHQALAAYRGQKIVTFHEAFPYFAKEFGFEIAAVIEREPGSEPSAREMARTIDLIKKSGIRAVFVEPQYPSAAAQAISRESGVGVFTLDPAVTGPMDPDAYLTIMENNLKTLQGAFR